MVVASRRAWLFFIAAITALAFPDPAHGQLAYTWGNNVSGQIGNNTQNNQPTPYQAYPSGATGIAGAFYDSYVIRNGAVFASGMNESGQLGNNTTNDSNVFLPVQVLTSGVTLITGGNSGALAVMNGAAYAWGKNTSGQVGNGTVSAAVLTPTAVSVLTSGVTAVSSSSAFNLAIKGGVAYAWGLNLSGQIGNGSTSSSVSTPTAVTGLPAGTVTAVNAGNTHSLAIVNGGAYAWGAGGSGQLGNNTTTTSQTTPVPVTNMTSGVTAISGGNTFSLAVKNGAVYAWGNNGSGQLGNNSTTNSSVPVLVQTPAGVTFTDVSAGSGYGLALSTDNRLFAWGDNSANQFGNGNTNSSLVPVEVMAPSGFKFVMIEAGGSHALALATAAVPEPTSVLAVGAVGAAALRLRRKAKAVAV